MTPPRPRILLCLEYATLNGGEHSLLAAVRQLTQSKLDFIAAAPSTGPLLEKLSELKIPTLPLNLRDQSGHKLSKEEINSYLIKLIEDVQPDLVHANSLAMGRLLGRIAGDVAAPITTHIRDIIRLSDKAIEDLNQLDRLIAVSGATAKYHQERGLSAGKLTVLHNGVDSDWFQPRTPTYQLKKELGLGPEAFLIANIGQICLRKGQDVAAEAVCRLIDSYPELHLAFVGERHSQKAESIAYEENLREIFANAGREDHVHFLGYRSDIEFILNEVDLLLHTAHQEPLGRVLLEGAASECPIIATTAGGTSEILEHNLSGILLPPGDADLVEFALRDLIPDAQRRQELGREARLRILQRFTVERSTSGLLDIWKQLL